jgi:hypothetical protein
LTDGSGIGSVNVNGSGWGGRGTVGDCAAFAGCADGHDVWAMTGAGALLPGRVDSCSIVGRSGPHVTRNRPWAALWAFRNSVDFRSGAPLVVNLQRCRHHCRDLRPARRHVLRRVGIPQESRDKLALNDTLDRLASGLADGVADGPADGPRGQAAKRPEPFAQKGQGEGRETDASSAVNLLRKRFSHRPGGHAVGRLFLRLLLRQWSRGGSRSRVIA